MKSLSLKNPGGRILLTVLASLLILSAYFVIYSYYSYLETTEEDMLMRLDGIARTLAVNMDGDAHEYLIRNYREKNAITESEQDSVYFQIHRQLRQVYEENDLNTDIYTMVYDREANNFFFVATSSNTPYYRHRYQSFPRTVVENYTSGGTIDAYQTENGTWLSAFAPITNAEGKVVAVVQTDMRFDDFITRAREHLYINLMIVLFAFLIIAAVLFTYVRKILVQEEQAKQALRESNKIIEEKNKNIMDSINYASRIQGAVLPGEEMWKKQLPDSFVLFKPRDVVSGDFYFITRVKERIFFAVVDCTGHGVPGAMMSVMGSDQLNQIVMEEQVSTAAATLDELDKRVMQALNPEGTGVPDGMDLALCVMDAKSRTLQFAGANNPLLLIRNASAPSHDGGQLIEKPADNQPIGHYADKTPFTNHTLKLKKGDTIYIFSDGYSDQFGGPKGKKFMKKHFKKLLLSIRGKSMKAQKEILEQTLHDWMAESQEEQIDDICVIGVRL